MPSTTVSSGPRAPTVFVQHFDSLVSSGCLARLSGNAYKTLSVLSLAAIPLGTGSRQSQAFFRDLVAAGVVSPRDRGRLFACLRHHEIARRAGLSKNTLSRCTAELQAEGMVEKRRVHQAGGTAYNLFFLLPGAHLDKYNTLYPRQAPDRPARECPTSPATGPDPHPAQAGLPGPDSLPPAAPEAAGTFTASPPSATPRPAGSQPASTLPIPGSLPPAAPEVVAAATAAPPSAAPEPAGPRPASTLPLPTAGRPAPSGPVPQARTLPAVGTNSRSLPTTTPPSTRGAARRPAGKRPGPSPAADRAAAGPPTPAHGPPGLEVPPALVHARALYRTEIGLVTPLVDGELRRLAAEHPDPLTWDTAFLEAVRANVRQLRYVGRVLEARAAGTSRNHSPVGGTHVSRNRSSRRTERKGRSRPARQSVTDEELAEAQRRAAAVEPLDLLATLGTARA